MRKIIEEKFIMSILDLMIEKGQICDDCQVEKKTKMSHKKVQHLTTTHALELLHMDIIVPMQVKSLGGKICVFVYVNDYS